MEALFKLQNNYKSIIEKGRSNFKKSPKDRLTQTYIETRLESLEKHWNQFHDTHKNIVEEATDDDLKHAYFEKELFDVTEEIYISYKTELKQLITTPIPKVTTQTQSKVSTNVKLPKISLPIFSGLYTEWISFRDLFLSLIHNNDCIDDVQRLHYLKNHLSGEAEQLLRNTPITASNYSKCWSTLTKRYDNKQFLSQGMLKRFARQPAIVKESSTAIKHLLDTTVDCLHGLRTIGVDVSTWDTIVIFFVCEKLDTESRKLWEAKISINDNLAKFCEFQEFLESRFRSLEFLDSPVNKQTINSNRKGTAKTFHVASQVCVLCSGDHKLCNCKQFAKQDCVARREFVQANKLCFNCLGKNHAVYSCRLSTKCHICKKKHHTLLHLKPTDNAAEPVDSSVDKKVVVAAAAATSNQSECTKPICCFADVHSQGLLPTALVNIESKTGTAIVLRALIDQGSQVSFITESAVQLLGLRKTSAHTDIFRLGDDEGVSMPSKWIVKFKLQSRLDPSFVLYVDAYVLNRLTSRLPERRIVQVNSAISSLELADPSFDTPGRIDLLLSTRVVSQVLQDGVVKGLPGMPIAQKTKLGWIISGEVHTPLRSTPICCNAIAAPDINGLLRKFWELESESSVQKVMLTEEEQKCEKFFADTTSRDDEGRYIVKLPFKTDNPGCVHGRSEDVARKRFHMLERRLLRNPELQKQYGSVIQEYIQLGHIELVPQAEMQNNAFYLPHHAVVRDDKCTTKVRVVFDASCSGYNGVSLNDDLMVGPTLQPDLRQIIMRWRCHPITLVADIVKMYRQIKISKDNVDYQRILWRDNPDSELLHLRLLRVTFGVSSAPYLAVRSLQQLARDEGEDFPLVADRILKDYYVDDFLSGCQSVAEGEQIYHDMEQLLGRGGFQLQKWTSNNDELMDKMKNRCESVNENLEFKIDKIMKILGLTWNRKTDEFQYTVQLPVLQTPVTKRKVISDIARLFDPLGWLAPVIISAKMFIQRLWLSGIGWDEELPDNLLKDWLNFRSNLHYLSDFHIPRWIHTSQHDIHLELQGFSDASNTAYAAVVYTRCIDSSGHVHVSLVASKTKVAPVKQVSIPRLELCGAVLLSKLLCEVSDTLGIPKQNIHAWTDSSVVLAWLSSHPSRWKTFVANRVADILTVTDRHQWSHIQSKDNPADCASRGVNPCNPRNKCALQPGHSLMDWIRLGNSGKDLTGVGGRIRPVSRDELATHNTLNDAWLAIRGRVYNITHYLPYHPGGPEELMRGAGLDATQLFDKVHPWVNYDSLLAKCLVGPLRFDVPDAEELFDTTTPSPKSDRLREPSKAQELVRKSMENLANCITPVKKKITSKSDETAKGSPPSKIMQSLIQSADLPVSISRRAASSPVKKAESPESPVPLRYDWIQTSTKLTISVYTGYLANPGGCARITEEFLLIEVATNGWLRTLKMKTEAKLKEPLQLRVFAESGKIEVTALKAEACIWKGCGEAIIGATSRVSSPRSVECRVMKIGKVSHDTSLLSVCPRAGPVVVPLGHHVRVHKRIDGSECVRSYTPVGEGWSSTDASDVYSALRLAVKKYDSGALSPHLTGLNAGDLITLSGPYGNFQLQKLKTVKTLYLIAAGTGITPMLGLMKFMLSRSNPRCERTHLLFFNKTEKDILFRDNFEDMTNEDDRLTITHILSDASSSWRGHKGRISTELLTVILGNIKCTTECTHFACLCGPTDFTYAGLELLKKQGMTENCVHAFMG